MDILQVIKKQLIDRLCAYQPMDSTGIGCIEVEGEGDFPTLSWLKAQPLYPQLYLHFRQDEKDEQIKKIVAVGKVRSFSDLNLAQDFVQQHHYALVGGLQFNGQALFFLPFLWIETTSSTWRVRLFIEHQDFQHKKAQWLAQLETFAKQTALCEVETDYQLCKQQADQALWQNWVEQALQLIQQKRLSKLVLANQSHFLTAQAIDGKDLLSKSEQVNWGCYHFLLAQSPELTFLGSTPECLYRRDKNHIKTEALAGTASTGNNDIENQQFGEWLLSDSKNDYENQLVVEGICQNLQPYVNELKVAPVELKKLRQVQHLRRKIQGELAPHFSDQDLLQAMHPTAAIAGLPQRLAQQTVQQIENFDRSWYAGAIGVMSEDYAEFCVSIRSAFLEPQGQQSLLRVFAGAGIVAGSAPQLEWQEIERKATGLLSLLQNKNQKEG